MATKPEFISLLRDVRDVKYPDIVTKHANVAEKEALMNPHYTAIDGVYNNAANVTSVANNEDNINSVKENEANIDIIADNKENVINIGSNIEKVITVSESIDNVSLVSANIDIVNITSSNIDDVNLVSSNIEDVNNVSSNIDVMNNVLSNITDIQNAEDNAKIAKDAVSTTNDNVAITNDNVNKTNIDASNTKSDRDFVANEINKITELSAKAITLIPDSSADASYNASTGILTIGVPQGAKGDKGEAFKIDASGINTDRENYNDQNKGYTFLSTNGDLEKPELVVDGSNFYGTLNPDADGISWDDADDNLALENKFTYLVTIEGMTTGSLQISEGDSVIHTFLEDVESYAMTVIIHNTDVTLKGLDDFDGDVTISVKAYREPTSVVFFKTSDDDGDYWSEANRFGVGDKGEKGDTGIGIFSIVRTDGDGSPGTDDTYTLTYTDGSKTEFSVHNGADGDLIADNNLSDLENIVTAKINLGIENVDNTSDADKPISNAAQEVFDSLSSSIANLATAQTSISEDASIDIDTTNQLIGINTTTPSTDTSVLDTNDDDDTMTFKMNASVNFLASMVFTSNTSDERLVSIKVINNDTDDELDSFDMALTIPDGSTETISHTFLLTVGKNGTPSAPLIVRFEMTADDTDYTLDSFNAVIALSSSYDAEVQTGNIDCGGASNDSTSFIDGGGASSTYE